MKPKKNMISKNIMISLTAMMFLILILFQVSASSVGYFQEEKNRQIAEEKRLTQKDEAKETKRFFQTKKKTYIWRDKEEIPAAVTEGLILCKQPYETVTALKQALNSAEQTECFILCRTQYSEKEIETLKILANKGVNLIFPVLPKKLETMPALMELLGVDKVLNNKTNTRGIRVLEDYMLGGRSDYKKLSVHNIPWLQLEGSTKTYMCGLFKNYEENGIKNEELPPLAWRNWYGSAYVFAFNGNFMKEKSNLGMFISAEANMKDVFLYPVINARVLFVNNFPYLTSENDKEMQKQYSMSSRRFLEDNMLPDLVAITEKTGDVISAAANVSFDKEQETGKEKEQDTLESFQNILLKQSGEIGIGFYDKNDSAQKVHSNLDYFRNNTQMKFPFFYGGGLRKEELLEVKHKIPEVGTVIQNWEELEQGAFRFLEDDLISVPITSSGYAYSDEENLKLKNAISGMGVSNHKIDMEEVVYPKGSKDNWRYQSVELGKNLDTYWKPYQAFKAVSLAEEGKRVRQYLLMDYDVQTTNSNEEVQIEIENLHTEVYFLLRTNREISYVEGGEWEQVEEGAYLLTIQQEQAKLVLKDVNEKE